MCGIAGIFSTEQDLNQPQSHDKLSAMQGALAHRGPDGQGEFISPSGAALLCHTRLSIIDLSSAGHQPMTCDANRYTITFNGEIYNYQTLRADLEHSGESFVSDSDTEVILKLYQQHGANCVEYLRGMYAFVIWDEHQKSAFAARDPLGIKPFYYCANSDGKFAFASELRSLLKADLHSPSLSKDGIKSYFLSGTVAEPNTVMADIFQLPAGSSLSWQNGNFTLRTFWELPFASAAIKETSKEKELNIARTRNALESTVKAHFVSDVPVGIFLSGGIDSTALVALASKVTNAQLNTYSIAFESPEWNEGEIAKRVARHFGTNHTEFLLTPEIAKPLFTEFLSVVDQPTTDGFNTFCVSRFASEAGEKVVLSGVGGDELFAGYKSFQLLPKMQQTSQRTAWLAPLFKCLNRLLSKHLPSKLQRALDFLGSPGSLLAAHRSLRGIFSEGESLALCESMGLDKLQHVEASDPDIAKLSVADQVSQLEITSYMRNQLLRDSDVMSMACGLELRVPFVDKELIETILSIPSEQRLSFGKTLLVDAVPELPDWVVNRPKQGFRFPFDEWFSSQWSDLPIAKGVPAWIKLTPWYRRWSLLVLHDWKTRHLKPE